MKSSCGFTLVEMSIVLVIIGLIVGGVLVGKEMLDTAQRTRVVKLFTQYQAIYAAFQTKYDAVPGDMKKAGAYWGATCDALVDGGSFNCNGDGNGVIEYTTDKNRFPVHLYFAEMLPTNSINGWNSAMNPVRLLYEGAYAYASSGDPYDANVPAQNTVHFYGKPPNPTNNGSFLKPQDALAIDMKLDDGSPIKGKLYSSLGQDLHDGACLTAGNEYDITNPGIACKVTYVIGN